MEELVAGTMNFITRHGAWAGPIVGLLTFTESLAVVGILIPGTAALLGIGGLVGAGVIDAVPVFLWAVAGAFLGACLSYGFGRRIGHKAYRSWPLNRNREAVARTRLFFRKYGFATVFVGRFLGPLRAIVPMVAGVMEMSRRRFQLSNLTSAVIWVPSLLAPGYFAGQGLGSDVAVTEFHVLVFTVGVVVLTISSAWAGSRVMRGGSNSRARRRARKVASKDET